MQQYYRIGDIYAKALIASAGNKAAELSAQLRTLCDAFSANNTLRLLQDPAVSDTHKINAVEAVIDKKNFQPLLKGLFAVLIERKRLAALPAITEKTEERVRAAGGKVAAIIECATALKTPEKKRIITGLEKALEKTIEAEFRTKPSLIGGLRVYIGSALYDYSIDTRLKNLALYCKQQNVTYSEPQ